MIVILKPDASEEKIRQLCSHFEAMGLSIHHSQGENTTILGLVGDTSIVDGDAVAAEDIVEAVKRISEPYKAANRKFHPMDSVYEVAGKKIGAGYFNVFGGPCSIESEEQIILCARAIQAAGASFLRGGAFKPRTSPYSFQGLEEDGLKLLLEAKKQVGIPIVTEIMSERHLDLFEEVDIIQVGARNMQNFMLLKELGKCKKPILLKRGLSSTVEELLMSAEYIMAGGNEQVILCERGIRTFETSVRNTLDISAIPVIKKMSHLPVIVDPSHAAGNSWMIDALSRAAIAAGADGVMIEAHNNPKRALCDGAQSVDLTRFAEIMQDVAKRVAFEGRILEHA
mgnify:CR=1 FL=1